MSDNLLVSILTKYDSWSAISKAASISITEPLAISKYRSFLAGIALTILQRYLNEPIKLPSNL